MTAENPEGVLEGDGAGGDGSDTGPTPGVAVLVVAAGLTSIWLGTMALGGGSVPLLALVATVWLCGTGLRATEVLKR